MTTADRGGNEALSFVTTRWTQVLKARGQTPEARAALGELCAAYWTPIFRFVRRSGCNEETARDQTQEFIAQLLARNGLDRAEPSKGRFRSYLLGAVKHFLADQLDRASAAKRGGGRPTMPIGDPTETSTAFEVADPSVVIPDTFFDRHWAFEVIERALRRLAEECASAGRKDHFEILKPWLVAEADMLSPPEAAVRLGLSEGSFKVAVHRLRKRFRALVRAEIAQTVEGPEQVQEELRYLVEVLSRAA